MCQQEFITSPSSVLVPPGNNATLACLVRNMVGECRWQKNGKPVGLHPGKYSMPGVGEKGDCSISIARVDLRIDDGEWECQVGSSCRLTTLTMLCQVTSSNVSSQDALVSRPARLTVQGK